MPTSAEAALTWRPLTTADLPLLTAWLREPRVARWWHHDTTAEAVEADFGPSVRGDEPGEDLVVSLNGRPIGLVQRSKIGDYPEDLEEFAAIVAVPDGAVELDYLIGEAGLRGRGIGPRMIAAVVEDTWIAHPAAPAVLVAVVAANYASWRALEKAGLRRIAEGAMSPDNPVDDPLHYIYRIDRPAARDVILVVDIANVMGSRPDGWWRDRRAAAARLLTALGPVIGTETAGPDGRNLRIARLMAVLEGAARGAVPPSGVPPSGVVTATTARASHRPAVEVVDAERDGDSTIVAVTETLVEALPPAELAIADRPAVLVVTADRPAVLVVTADRGLRRRLPPDVTTVGPEWLNRLIGR